MITVPPTTDNPDTAGSNSAVQGVAKVPAAISARPYAPGPSQPVEPADATAAGEAWPDDVDPEFEAAVTAHAERLRDVVDDAELDQRRRDVVDSAASTVAGDDPQLRAILAGPNGTALPTALGVEPTLPAGRLQPGMLLAHMEQGEPVGLEIRHVEPYVDGSGVTIVMAGGHVEHCAVDQPLEVVDPAEAEAARARLAAKQRTGGQAAVLRHIATLADAGELPIPYHLRVEGDLPSLDVLHAAADTLGVAAVEEQPGFWRVARRFGADDKYTAPVELSFTHYTSTGSGQGSS
jgi:hypothetical protein